MKGIIFTESNFLLTVHGIKRQTRRIIRAPKYAVDMQVHTRAIDGAFLGCFALNENERTANPKTGQEWVINPRYKVGEIVYLKEPYYEWDDWDAEDGQFSYKFDNPEKLVPFWENKLFMPEKAARYFIKITGVRAELLQDISEEDCLLEGVKIGRCGNESNWMKAFYAPDDNQPYITAKRAYEEAFNKINGKGTWDSNPFVWVYDYELTKQF